MTLAPLLTTYLDQDAEQYLLHSVSAGGSAVVTGPEWGNIQEIDSGYFATVEPAMAVGVDAGSGVADSDSPYWGGNIEAQSAPPRPSVSIFVGLDPLSETPLIGADEYAANAKRDLLKTLQLTVATKTHANAEAFLAALPNTHTGALAVIGHGTRGVPDAGETIGIGLYDKYIISSATTSVPRDPVGNVLPYQSVTSLTTPTRIVYAAACWIGPLFQNLWRSPTGSGVPTLVVAEAVDAPLSALIRMNRAAEAWLAVLRRLTGQWNGVRMTVGDAVKSVNGSSVITEVDEGETRFILKVIGNPNEKLR